jgi:type II secretory pathway pseudopilin PulG
MRSGRAGRLARGFTYVAMLVFVAIIGIGLAGTAEVWSLAQQREKEAELLFVGNQYREAIGRYYDATPGGGRRYPEKLEYLLEDNRYPMPRRHLRKLYADPLTGKAEWGLMEAPDGGIMGVYSLSTGTPLKQAEFGNTDRTFHQGTTYGEWRFFHEPELEAPVISAK